MRSKLFLLISAVVAFLCLVACKSTQRVIETHHGQDTAYIVEVHNDTIYKAVETVRHDSVHVTDSVLVKTAGDTVFVTRYRTVYKYITLSAKQNGREVSANNGLQYITRSDTVRIPVPVERKLNIWEKTTGKYRVVFVAILIIVAVGSLIWLFHRRK